MCSRRSLPASPFEKSRMSLITESSSCAERFTVSASLRWRGASGVSSSRSVIPITPFIGVRISWLMLARNCDFERLASSAWLRQSDSASFLAASSASVRSCTLCLERALLVRRPRAGSRARRCAIQSKARATSPISSLRVLSRRASKSPLPRRSAASWMRWIGRTQLRARKRLARIASPKAMPPARTRFARACASASRSASSDAATRRSRSSTPWTDRTSPCAGRAGRLLEGEPRAAQIRPVRERDVAHRLDGDEAADLVAARGHRHRDRRHRDAALCEQATIARIGRARCERRVAAGGDHASLAIEERDGGGAVPLGELPGVERERRRVIHLEIGAELRRARDRAVALVERAEMRLHQLRRGLRRAIEALVRRRARGRARACAPAPRRRAS